MSLLTAAAEEHFRTTGGSTYSYKNHATATLNPEYTITRLYWSGSPRSVLYDKDSKVTCDVLADLIIQDDKHVIKSANLVLGRDVVGRGVYDYHTQFWNFYRPLLKVMSKIEPSGWLAFLSPKTLLHTVVSYDTTEPATVHLLSDCAIIHTDYHQNKKLCQSQLVNRPLFTTPGTPRPVVSYFHGHSHIEI